MSDVVELNCLTRLPIPPERVLRGANEFHVEHPFEEVLVCGFDEEGELQLFASEAEKARILWLLKKAELFILTEAQET